MATKEQKTRYARNYRIKNKLKILAYREANKSKTSAYYKEYYRSHLKMKEGYMKITIPKDLEKKVRALIQKYETR